MVRCVVSGCLNRSVPTNRGIYKPAPKRFFKFPEDPARVKVWLAALRELDKEDSTEQHQICEDHFLPEDITADGVNPRAIPIMPPDLSLMTPWAAESSEEEEQWGTGGCKDDEEEEEEEGGEEAFLELDPPQQDSGAGLENPPEPETASTAEPQVNSVPVRKTRQDVSLSTLTQGFLELLKASPDGSVDLREAVYSLKTRQRRVYDITNVLEGINLIQKQTKNRVKWIGPCSISSILSKQSHKLKELQNLKQVENTLDGLIKSCARQLFDMTDDVENAAYPLTTFQEQTVIVVKAPEETKLEIPAPREDVIQIHLKAVRGSIMVVTCEVESGQTTTSDSGEKSRAFLTLEGSRIKTATLSTGSSGLQSAVQSA
ncbi:transcription factor E2F2-like [Xyrichtys novacula]|uniref:Transcription factor E2F2-like n=1 Tax=Xyrichtys novacula TaxID=13765 RepID=A0AAV1H0H9_XYRNO|nr:transcription factor E2F2-like [Xyrichtys novacula]